MAYFVLKPRTKKEEALIKQFAEMNRLSFKTVALKKYTRDISESRKEIKAGKKISLSDLEDGL
jgi:hypothetical protein